MASPGTSPGTPERRPWPRIPSSIRWSKAARTSPQLPHLLLTDLCNSTEPGGKDRRCAQRQLFQAHDRLVLELQHRWCARLIDRSDGLLLLFERAIDGLGFALDYVRGCARSAANTAPNCRRAPACTWAKC